MPLFCEFSRTLITGRSGSGKSELIRRILLKYHLLFTTKIEHFLYISPSPPNFTKEFPKLKVLEDIPDEIQEHSLVLVDDFMLDKQILRKVARISIRDIHHSSSNLIFISQKFYIDDPNYRVILDNLTSIILFRQNRGYQMLHRLAAEIFPSSLREYFWDTYHKVTNKKYGYLFIDLSGNTPTGENLFSNICAEVESGIVKWIK